MGFFLCYTLNVVTIKHVFSFDAGVQMLIWMSIRANRVLTQTRQKRDTDDGTGKGRLTKWR